VAQYDIYVSQNTAAAGIEFTEKVITPPGKHAFMGWDGDGIEPVGFFIDELTAGTPEMSDYMIIHDISAGDDNYHKNITLQDLSDLILPDALWEVDGTALQPVTETGIKVDGINEKTLNAGVTIEGVKIEALSTADSRLSTYNRDLILTAYASSGAGKSIYLAGGVAASGDSAGGDVHITGGEATGAGNGGGVVINGGVPDSGSALPAK